MLFHLLSRGKRKGRTIEYYKSPLEKVPVHAAVLEDRKCSEAFGRVVGKIIERKRCNSAADTSAWEYEIERLVYRLYGLTAEEIAIVEEAAASANRASVQG